MSADRLTRFIGLSWVVAKSCRGVKARQDKLKIVAILSPMATATATPTPAAEIADLRIYVKGLVSETGSLSEAARRLGMCRATVRAVVKDLDVQRGTVLQLREAVGRVKGS